MTTFDTLSSAPKHPLTHAPRTLSGRIDEDLTDAVAFTLDEPVPDVLSHAPPAVDAVRPDATPLEELEDGQIAMIPQTLPQEASDRRTSTSFPTVASPPAQVRPKAALPLPFANPVQDADPNAPQITPQVAPAPVLHVGPTAQAAGLATAVTEATLPTVAQVSLRGGGQNARDADTLLRPEKQTPRAGVEGRVALPAAAKAHAPPQTIASAPLPFATPVVKPDGISFESSRKDATDGSVISPGPTALSQTLLPHSPAAVQLRAYGQQVVQQITAAIVQTTGATTQIALNPQELGRVRIALTHTEAGLTVNIIAERPETTDLMRKQIDLLARDLHDLGFDNPTFTFDDQPGGSNDPQNDRPEPSTNAFDDAAIIVAAPPPQARIFQSAGLDLKL